MKNGGKNIGLLLTGMAVGAVLCGGAYAAGIVAQPTWQPIYVDGQQVQMKAYNINGNNYVKLRDIGKEVGFNVYWQDGVQVDSDADYTGEPPAQLTVSSYKGAELTIGDRSALIITNEEGDCKVTSSQPQVVTVERVSGNWVAVAKSAGKATISVVSSKGDESSITITVSDSAGTGSESDKAGAAASQEIREKMAELINEVRTEHGAPEIPINTALMDAAQACSDQCFTSHDRQFEGEAVSSSGYPNGFGSNLTWFTLQTGTDIAQKAVTNWVNSPGHFSTMIAQRYDCMGVGVTVKNNIAYCYLLMGNPNSVNAYA